MTFRQQVAERFGLSRFREAVLRRRVPETPWYLGDGAALATLLAVQIVTGATLMLYYSSAADHAFASVQNLTQQVPLGRLVRALHYWTAGLMMVVLAVHVFRHLILGGYKAPREGTWIVGVFLFVLVTTMSFTGYVLRWDERSVYALRVALNMFHKVPLIGEELVLLIQGAPQIGALTLVRIFAVHIWIVPLLLVGLTVWHLYLIVLHGVSFRGEQKQPVETAEEQKEVYEEAAESEERGEWFHPETVHLTGRIAFAVLVVAFALAVVVGPAELYPEANLIEPSRPLSEWWFWWYSALIALLPPAAAPIFLVGFPLVLVAGMLVLPLVDRGPDRGLRKRPLWAVFVVVATIAIVWLSDLRQREPWLGRPDPEPPPVPAGVVLDDQARTGRQLFAVYGCNSCHAVSGRGGSVGPDLARIERRYSPTELEGYILEPPQDVAMPSYRGRMAPGDLERVVAFVLAAQTFPRRQ
ncbi:MAG: cytochrome b N-terminal domain-containing protein [Candidatus Krumholzibacteriia bacterium]